MTIKKHLDTLFTGKKVKIIIGHPSNDTHIIGTVVGFTEKLTPTKNSILILLKDVITNKKQYEDYCANGRFNEIRIDLDTDIELLRDTNLDKILN